MDINLRSANMSIISTGSFFKRGITFLVREGHSHQEEICLTHLGAINGTKAALVSVSIQ